MDAGEIERLFSGPGGYRFARWGRAIAPVVFGVEDETLGIVKGAVEAVVRLSGHEMAETDPELGANLMVFFLREWDELRGVPNLDRLLPDLGALVDRLEAEGAARYRAFRFDRAGGIMAAFTFLRVPEAAVGEDEEAKGVEAETLALDEAVRCILAWSEGAFAARSPLAVVEEDSVEGDSVEGDPVNGASGEGASGPRAVILRPDVAGVIRAAYDPVLPVAARDASHAMRLAARLGAGSDSGSGPDLGSGSA